MSAKKISATALVAASWLISATYAHAIVVGSPFGPNGEGGLVNNQTLQVGPGGIVFELDAFLNIAGQDLNGAALGTSAQLSFDPLPVGLDFNFNHALSSDATDLTLEYSFTNNTGGDIPGVTFLSFLDAEIDEAINTFFNEVAATSGTVAAGQNFEVDEPGFVFGDIFDNLFVGALDGTNALPPGTPDDVSMAFSFDLGTLVMGDVARINLLISEDGDTLGPFSITHFDPDSNSAPDIADTSITYSGAVSVAAIPEPGSLLLMAAGLVGVASARRRVKS